VELRQTEDELKQDPSAFPTGLWLAVMPQFFNRLLKLKSDDIHERTFEGRFSKSNPQFFFRDFLNHGSKGALNRRPHSIADQIFQIVTRRTHGFTTSFMVAIWPRSRNTSPQIPRIGTTPGCNPGIVGGKCGIRGRVEKYSHYFHLSGSIIRCFASASSNAAAI